MKLRLLVSNSLTTATAGDASSSSKVIVVKYATLVARYRIVTIISDVTIARGRFLYGFCKKKKSIDYVVANQVNNTSLHPLYYVDAYNNLFFFSVPNAHPGAYAEMVVICKIRSMYHLLLAPFHCPVFHALMLDQIFSA